jgi:hypothetical protein
VIKTCLTCKWFSEPTKTHKWHQCEWPYLERIPGAMKIVRLSINIQSPCENCPAYEEEIA